MYYSNAITFDVANGEGFRTSLFVSGCTHHCAGCFNQETWDYSFGHEYTEDVDKAVRNSLLNEHITGLSLLGGDPLCQNEKDLQTLIDLVDYTHSIGKNVWLWTGFKWEHIKPGKAKELTEKADVLVDGPFIQKEKELDLPWRGSKNQRVIDVQRTLDEGELKYYESDVG